MSRFTLTIKNLRAVRALRWSPSGACLLIGANGAGKTTVLLTLALLRTALERGLPEAIAVVLGGSHGLKHHDAADDEAIELGVELDDLHWWLRLHIRGWSGEAITEETLSAGGLEVFHRDALGRLRFGAHQIASDRRLGLRMALDSAVQDSALVDPVKRMAGFIRSLSVYLDPDLTALRGGSATTETHALRSRGQNALTMLRAWHQQRPERARHDFVLSGLRAAFPRLIEDIDFVEAGNTLAARIYRPGRETPAPLGTEANGLLSMLVSLCDLAAANEGGVVAIDEPENALHPYAIRAFARRAEAVARQKNVTVILSTHSPVLLDHFNAEPASVFVLDPDARPGPTRLTELANPEWLQQFRLGELYADGEIGSNAVDG